MWGHLFGQTSGEWQENLYEVPAPICEKLRFMPISRFPHFDSSVVRLVI
jgi:hypothetical protein